VRTETRGSTTELLTSEQVAHLLQTTTRFMRRLVNQRRIEYVKVGRLVRFTPAAVERYIERQTVTPLDRAQLRQMLREADR
jgi:excisionase family DNA binding protein